MHCIRHFGQSKQYRISQKLSNLRMDKIDNPMKFANMEYCGVVAMSVQPTNFQKRLLQ